MDMGHPLFPHSTPPADKYSILCRITADTSVAAKSLKAQRCSDGTSYYRLNLSVIMLFGMTELKAQLAWVEDVSCAVLMNHASCFRAKRRGITVLLLADSLA